MSTKKPNRFLIALTLLLAGAAVLLAVQPERLALAAPPHSERGQIPIYTPTPGPDGRIIYIVKAGETLTSISLLTGVSLEDLRALNNLQNDNIIEGQPLLLGLAGPPEVTPTLGPSPTPTSLLPTPSPVPGSGNLCILLFNDLNGDSLRQDSEPSVPNGAVSVSEEFGAFSQTTSTTAGDEPVCMEGLPEGTYAVSVAAPEGYNPTTESSYSLELKAGDQTYIDFGAQVNAAGAVDAPVAAESSRSPLLGILGGLLLLASAGLAVFASRLLKSR